MDSIPKSHRDLITDEKKAFASLATLMDDGSPQLTPVWFDVEGEFLRINTVRGRVKDRNPEDPYRYIHIRGTVIGERVDDAVEHTHILAKKYLDVEKNPWHEGQSRVIFLIRPDTVSSMG